MEIITLFIKHGGRKHLFLFLVSAEIESTGL